MPPFLPASLHRLALRGAHAARLRLWGALRLEVRGCNVLAFDRDGRLLLVRHSYQQPDLWMLPGGGLARGEDAAAAAMRELAEETGCRLVQAVWFGSDRVAMPGGWRNRVEMVTGHTHDTPKADGLEIEEARFFALDALPASISAAVHRRVALWRAWRAENEGGQVAC
ncbi:NUDIX domain-containing protein [Novosphingobium sp. EMRT-2]|uniref:NUDIX domain-containing protein n=1 Tax=Novosphingobium sp. EMRT-2 TaxID=2571749 RepID=UPI0010BD40D2|nr:NUDIX domain-containing protein [Novosphingobium sp. EMRT-2]QCI94498.1 NUDIX domain-containing protein [Novosphingobium sp. EMRT-2]